MFKNRENTFYLSIGIAVFVFGLSIQSGLYACIALPIALGVVMVGFWAFGKEKPSD